MEELLIATAGLEPGAGFRPWTCAPWRQNRCRLCIVELSLRIGVPHDTAIVIAGLVRAGLADHGTGLIEGLLRAIGCLRATAAQNCGAAKAGRVPYPAACRPQAWSAASAVVVAGALDVPSDLRAIGSRT